VCFGERDRENSIGIGGALEAEVTSTREGDIKPSSGNSFAVEKRTQSRFPNFFRETYGRHLDTGVSGGKDEKTVSSKAYQKTRG